MDVELLVSRYPTIYHMAEAGSWESISRRGLLSTSALLDLFDVRGAERRAIESSRRDECVDLCHEEFGTVTIRDNKPMTDLALKKSLDDDLSPNDWYEILNARCFFWVSERRLEGLLSARAYRNKEHVVLGVDSRSLVEAHLDRISLSPYNSGSTFPANPRRGLSTFLRIADYPFEHHKRRNSRDPIVELAIDYSVPDIVDHTLEVRRMHRSEVIETLWTRG